MQPDKKDHFIIVERRTEEEFIITLTDLIISAGYKVSLFISEKIWKLIKDDINVEDIEKFEVFKNNTEINKILQLLETYINLKKTKLIFIASFLPFNIKETKLLVPFLRKYPVCTKISLREIWLNKFPPIIFDKRKIIRAHKIIDWYMCKIMFRHYHSFFITDLHTGRINPSIKDIEKKSGKHVFTFPFKIKKNKYKPETNISKPVFVIPGAIDESRRDYLSIISIFKNSDLGNKKWKLILLGRPVGRYGKKIIRITEKINSALGEKKIVYFNNYLQREEFELYMNSSTHIIAPINPSGYENGKDSGAIYDIFKYNKIGIVNNKYFHCNNLEEKKVILTYSNIEELSQIINHIIENTMDYPGLTDSLQSINDIFCKEKYVKEIKMYINKYLRKN